MKLCECGCGRFAKKRFIHGHNQKGISPPNKGIGLERRCIECKKQRTIKGRGRCSGCYKRMLKSGLPNDYKPKNPNAGQFQTGERPINKGGRLSEEQKKYLSVINDGKNNPRYKHGRWITWHKKARKIVEQQIGRKLREKEVVHHKDGDITNNNLNNLQLMDSHGKHMDFHWKLQKDKNQDGRFKSLKAKNDILPNKSP